MSSVSDGDRVRGHVAPVFCCPLRKGVEDPLEDANDAPVNTHGGYLACEGTLAPRRAGLVTVTRLRAYQILTDFDRQALTRSRHCGTFRTPTTLLVHG